MGLARSEPRMASPLGLGSSCSARSPCAAPRTPWRVFSSRIWYQRRCRQAVCRVHPPVPVAEPADVRIGFLGLGIMGRPMATRLIRAGYDVIVWNRTAEVADELAAGGAEIAGCAAEVTEAADITIAMLSDPDACLEVALGPGGAVQGLCAGKGYIDASTIDAETSRQLSHVVNATGAKYLEAPVSGSKGPAEQGTLIFMTAGDKSLYQAAQPLFAALGKLHLYLGEAGIAEQMKLVVNMMMGSMMATFAEGLLLAEGTGVNPQDLLTVLNQSALASPMLALKGPLMLKHNFTAAFPLKHQQKDLNLALRAGAETGQYLPMAAAANELYLRAKLHGQGDRDFSAVITALEKAP